MAGSGASAEHPECIPDNFSFFKPLENNLQSTKNNMQY